MPSRAKPLAQVRRKSCSANAAYPEAAAHRAALVLTSTRLPARRRRCVVKTKGDSVIRGASLENGEGGFAEWHFVRLIVLCPFGVAASTTGHQGRVRPTACVPTSSRRCPVSASSLTNGPNVPPSFSAAAHTRRSSSSFRTRSRACSGRWRLDASTGRGGEDVARDAPVEKLADRREHTIGCNRRAAVNDAVQYVEHVAAGDFVHHAATPARQDMLPKQPLGFLCCSRTVRASDVTLEKLFDDAVDAVGLGGAGQGLLAARVAAFGHAAQRLGGELAGVLEPEGRVAAEGELAWGALMSVADRPAFGTARLLKSGRGLAESCRGFLAEQARVSWLRQSGW